MARTEKVPEKMLGHGENSPTPVVDPCSDAQHTPSSHFSPGEVALSPPGSPPTLLTRPPPQSFSLMRTDTCSRSCEAT